MMESPQILSRHKLNMDDVTSLAQAVLPIAGGFLVLHYIFLVTAPSKLGRATAAYWATSVVSCIHSYIVCPYAWEALKPKEFITDLKYTTDLSTFVCHIYVRERDVSLLLRILIPAFLFGSHMYQIGYIIADTVPLIWHGMILNDKTWAGSESFIIHHILSILCWGMMAVRGQCHGVACGLLLLECTATFTNGQTFDCPHPYFDSLVLIFRPMDAFNSGWTVEEWTNLLRQWPPDGC
jgi:hypothetical protein